MISICSVDMDGGGALRKHPYNMLVAICVLVLVVGTFNLRKRVLHAYIQHFQSYMY